MTFNEGPWDRGIRIVAGIVLAYAAWLAWPASVMSGAGTLGLVLLAAGVVLLVTGLVGWCPTYTLFGFSTNKTIGA